MTFVGIWLCSSWSAETNIHRARFFTLLMKKGGGGGGGGDGSGSGEW